MPVPKWNRHFFCCFCEVVVVYIVFYAENVLQARVLSFVFICLSVLLV